MNKAKLALQAAIVLGVSIAIKSSLEDIIIGVGGALLIMFLWSKRP